MTAPAPPAPPAPPPVGMFPTWDALDIVCRFFGGPFNPPTSDYRTPQVTGLDIVQRSRPGEKDYRPLSLAGDVNGGSLLVVSIPRWTQARESGPVGHGWMQRRYTLNLHLHTRTVSLDPVVSWDACYQMADRLAAKIEADPTAGSGGWHDGGGGLWLGEGHGQSPTLTVDFSHPSPGKAYTQQVVVITTTATQYLIG